MTRFESVEVPFVVMGNRQVLTEEQLVEHPHLLAFFNRFRHCFELEMHSRCWVFVPGLIQ